MTCKSITVPVGIDRKIQTALRTNQIAGFVTVPSKKNNKSPYHMCMTYSTLKNTFWVITGQQFLCTLFPHFHISLKKILFLVIQLTILKLTELCLPYFFHNNTLDLCGIVFLLFI